MTRSGSYEGGESPAHDLDPCTQPSTRISLPDLLEWGFGLSVVGTPYDLHTHHRRQPGSSSRAGSTLRLDDLSPQTTAEGNRHAAIQLKSFNFYKQHPLRLERLHVNSAGQETPDVLAT
jgi:hypothetical protein